MKMNHNKIIADLTALSRELSFMTTEAEYGVDWHSVPNSKLEILSDRVKNIKTCFDQIFEIIQQHEKS